MGRMLYKSKIYIFCMTTWLNTTKHKSAMRSKSSHHLICSDPLGILKHCGNIYCMFFFQESFYWYMFGKWRQPNLQHTYLLEFMLPNYCVSHAKQSWLSLLPSLPLVPLHNFITIIYWIMNVFNEAKISQAAFVVISSTIRWGEGVLG